MIISEELLKKFGIIISIIVALLTAIKILKEIWPAFLTRLWRRIIYPMLKLLIAVATLILPIGCIIGFIMYRVAAYYLESGRPDYIITNQSVFVQLVTLQAVLVSIYSYLWTILVYSRISSWLTVWKLNATQLLNGKQNQDAQPMPDSADTIADQSTDTQHSSDESTS